MGSNREFCIERRKAEYKAFLKVLKAVPEDKQAYRPEPKSRSAAELAWLLAAEEKAVLTLIETGAVEWKDTPPPARVAESVATYEKAAAAVAEGLQKLDESAWQGNAKFLVDGKAVWEDTLQNIVWGFLFDAIHHRGQLSTYLRPMGSKVPAIYGPSADDAGGGS